VIVFLEASFDRQKQTLQQFFADVQNATPSVVIVSSYNLIHFRRYLYSCKYWVSLKDKKKKFEG
ncbi:MAG: hypothetical protein M3297_08345, partial [Thermoproteota archaeon]|nr:hypothetical protein [Thermoproteota archaeon]